jgi:nicotinamide-nucleotide amidase
MLVPEIGRARGWDRGVESLVGVLILRGMRVKMADQTESLLYSMLSNMREQLRSTGHRLALVESCTSGMVAAELGQIPGISEHFCGSMVVYRTPTKTDWLGIDRKLLQASHIGPVSREVTQRLVTAILERTPEASVAAAITGHLGPNAPAELDGQIFCCVGRRGISWQDLEVHGHILSHPAPQDEEDFAGRRARQQEATAKLLQAIESHLRT